MSRETKLGLIVSASFLSLIGVVVAAKLQEANALPLPDEGALAASAAEAVKPPRKTQAPEPTQEPLHLKTTPGTGPLTPAMHQEQNPTPTENPTVPPPESTPEPPAEEPPPLPVAAAPSPAAPEPPSPSPVGGDDDVVVSPPSPTSSATTPLVPPPAPVVEPPPSPVAGLPTPLPEPTPLPPSAPPVPAVTEPIEPPGVPPPEPIEVTPQTEPVGGPSPIPAPVAAPEPPPPAAVPTPGVPSTISPPPLPTPVTPPFGPTEPSAEEKVEPPAPAPVPTPLDEHQPQPPAPPVPDKSDLVVHPVTPAPVPTTPPGNQPPGVTPLPPIPPAAPPAADDSPEPAPVVQPDTRPMPPLGTSPVVQTPAIQIGTPTVQPRPPVGVPQVDSFDEQMYRCQGGDTFETVARRFCGSPEYAQALLLFNRAHPMASDGLQQVPPVLNAGTIVYIPPNKILEKRYPTVIPNLTVRNDKPTHLAQPNQPTPAAPVQSVWKKYRVRGPGERMIDIATRTLGNWERWKEIYKLNNQYQPHAMVPANAVLNLPPDATIDADHVP